MMDTALEQNKGKGETLHTDLRNPYFILSNLQKSVNSGIRPQKLSLKQKKIPSKSVE